MVQSETFDRGIYQVDPPTAAWRDWEQAARQYAVDLLIDSRESVKDESGAFARPFLPNQDFDAGDDLDSDFDSPLFEEEIDYVDDGYYHTFVLDADNGALENKTAIIYGLEDGDPDDSPTTEAIKVESGTGDLMDEFSIETMQASGDDDAKALLKNPIVIDVNEEVNISQYVVADGTEEVKTDNLILHGVVGVKRNTHLGTSSRFWSEQ